MMCGEGFREHSRKGKEERGRERKKVKEERVVYLKGKNTKE